MPATSQSVRAPRPVTDAGGTDHERLGDDRWSRLADIDDLADADRVALRQSRADRLVAFAAGDRRPLEEIRAEYLRRLHLRSDDYEATEGLRTVELALAATPHPEGPWSAQQRSRRHAGWWRRRRAGRPR